MKKLSLVSFLMMLLVFAGCAQKNPEVVEEVDTTETEAPEESKTEETVTDSLEDANKIYFEYDSYDVTDEMRTKLKAAVMLINKAPSIVLEGNADERGSDEYNQALGLKRAKSVQDALIAEGADAAKIDAPISLGELNPVCEDQTEECFAKNRRVEIKIK